jgi:hypothetical protein
MMAKLSASPVCEPKFIGRVFAKTLTNGERFSGAMATLSHAGESEVGQHVRSEEFLLAVRLTPMSGLLGRGD